ncbi:MAG: acyltransferase family protein [Xanthobacteraceae bacterium]
MGGPLPVMVFSQNSGLNRSVQMQSKDGMVSVDLARGAAALSVFAYHFQVGSILAKYTGIPGFLLIHLPGALYGVPLFFAISGYCIHRSEWSRLLRGESFNARGYMSRRFWRLYPAYLAALILSLLVGLAGGQLPSWRDVVVHVTMLQGFSVDSFNSINLVLWTLTVETCFYLVYPLWLRFRLRFGLYPAVGLAGLVTITSCAATSLVPSITYPVQWFFLNSWAGWIVGAALAEIVKPSGRFSRVWLAFGAVGWPTLIYLETANLIGPRQIAFEILARVVLCAWLLTFLIVNDSRLPQLPAPLNRLVTWIVKCGVFSYSLYLLHEPLIGLKFLVADLFTNVAARSVVQVAWFPLILTISYASYRAIELRFMRRRGSSPRSPPPVGSGSAEAETGCVSSQDVPVTAVVGAEVTCTANVRA